MATYKSMTDMSSGRVLFLQLIAVCCVLINISCASKRDIYDTFPLGSQISFEILSKAGQIIPINKGLVLVYNSSENWEYVDNHVLFFEKNIFYASCYLPSIKIDSIKANVLYATLDSVKYKRSNHLECDLPKNYSVSFTSKVGGRSGRKSDKIVNRISFSSTKENEILLDVMRSEDQYQGLR